MFKKVNEMKFPDQIILSIIIAFAVISFWRGIWGLMDLYLYPNDLRTSFIISLVIGLAILLITNYATKELM